MKEQYHKLIQDHLNLLADHSQLQFQHNQLQQEHESVSKDIEFLRGFYEDALAMRVILEPTPDLKEQLKLMPNLYKELLVEYIELIKKNILIAAMKVTDNVGQIVLMNGMALAANHIAANVETTKSQESPKFSMITRKPLEKKKKTKNKRRTKKALANIWK